MDLPSANVEDDKKTYQPPAEELAQLQRISKKIKDALQARNNPHRRLDNLGFIQDYYSNEDAANSYLRPKRNDDEVRVVGTTTEKRVESVVNELLSLNSQHEIHAYDRNNLEIASLGKSIEDVVTRTNQMEYEQDVLIEAAFELITQRAVFIEEVFDRADSSFGRGGICRKRLRTALEVILGDHTMPARRLQEQPFVATYDRCTKETAAAWFDWSHNWQYVVAGSEISHDVYGANATFRLGYLNENEVEICKYFSVPDNEFQVTVNGVPMYRPGKRLPFGRRRYPLAMAIAKRTSAMYAYGRPLTASLKYLQALNDETIRNIIRKFRQAIEPPQAVATTGKVYSRDMWNAGSITSGVDANAFKKLIDHNGVTDAEIAVTNLIKSMQDEASARSNTNLGVPTERKETATAIIEQQKEAIKMLGLLVLAWEGLRRDCTRLRIDNIIENLFQPLGRDIDQITGSLVNEYRQFVLKEQPFENGKTGDRVIKISDRPLTPDEVNDLSDWEDEQELIGKPTRVSVIDVNVFKKHDIYWFVTSTTKARESDALNRVMFQEKLAQGQSLAQITGRSLNGDRIINEFQETWRLKDWFLKPSDTTPPPQIPGQAQPGGDLAQQLTQGIGAGLTKSVMPSPTARASVGAAQTF